MILPMEEWQDPLDGHVGDEWTTSITVKGRIDVYGDLFDVELTNRSNTIHTVECSPFHESAGLIAFGRCHACIN